MSDKPTEIPSPKEKKPPKMAESKDEVSYYMWMWAFVIFIFIFIVATIVVVVIAVEETDDKLPKDIDIVIIERDPAQNPSEGRTEEDKIVTVNDRLSTLHARLVDKHLKFRNNIYILAHPDLGITEGSATVATGVDDCYYVNADATVPAPSTDAELLNAYFMAMKDVKSVVGVPDISSHAIFLSDRTFPLRRVYKTTMFHHEHPRMFNVFRNEAEQKVLGTDYYEYTPPSFPTAIASLDSTFLKESDTYSQQVDKIVMLAKTGQETFVRNDFNRDVLFHSDEVGATNVIVNKTEQTRELDRHTPLFATFHFSGVDKTTADAAMKEYLVSVIN